MREGRAPCLRPLGPCEAEVLHAPEGCTVPARPYASTIPGTASVLSATRYPHAPKPPWAFTAAHHRSAAARFTSLSGS